MAAFKTHFCSSGILGFGYGLLGASIGLSGEHSLLAGALCTLGGMLPDLDSRSSVTARETFTFLSAIVSILVIKQLSETQTAAHYLILFGIVTFFVMRVGVVGLFQRCTVHRGMWHRGIVARAQEPHLLARLPGCLPELSSTRAVGPL